MIICGYDYTLYLDYDRGQYHRLDLVGKIAYMRERVNRDLIHPCRLALHYQHRVAVGLLVPGLVCSGISAAATFLNGARAAARHDQSVFVNFVSRYMHQDLRRPLVNPNDRRVSNYADWLYCYIRCGLAHAFALEWGHIEGPPQFRAYVGTSALGQPQINQNELLEDFARGWGQYLDEVHAGAAVTASFETRFNEVFHD